MRNVIILLWLLSCVLSCKSSEINDISGTYILKNKVLYQALSDENNYGQLELKTDGTYLLSHAPIEFTPVIEQCDYASKGQWKKINNNVLDLTSENYYIQQEGYKYKLKEELKLSSDSVYIDIDLPKDFDDLIPTPEFNILFNYNTSKQIRTTKHKISISKKEYSLMGRKNHLILDLIFTPKGNVFYKNRLRYNILQDYALDIDKYNYYTISFPYFDQCFYEFEPYYHSNVFIKNKNILIWKGREWINQK